MHSRIYQINKTPIDRDDYIEESDYYDHWFINSVADYVNENTNRDEDIMWLKDCYEKQGVSFGKDDNGEYFVVEDKAKYFESKFENFQKALKEMSEKTLGDFIVGATDMLMYRIKDSYENKFGFYVEDGDCGLTTFDNFMRSATDGEKYYIGATIDYHF